MHTKESGNLTKLKVKEPIYILMVLNMWVIGKTICNMGREKKLLKMDHTLRDNIRMVIRVAKVLSFGLMAVSSKESYKTIVFLVEYTNGQMAVDTKVHGRTIK
jgi:hypothetical protein